MVEDEFVTMSNKNIEKCIFCNGKLLKNGDIKNTICFNCMAHLIKNIDIEPNKNYSEYIDFAYNAKNRLLKGEDIVSIFDNAPDGFDEWVRRNSLKTGFGITLE